MKTSNIFDLITVRAVRKPRKHRERALPAAAVISFWAVRHIPTGYYLPEVYGSNGRGGSHVEPASRDERRPRLFTSHRAATNYLASWLRGKFLHSSGYDSGSPYSAPEYYEDVWVEPVESRKKEEMEIIELKLEIP